MSVARADSVRVMYEPVSPEALSLFYSDTRKYAFWFQTYMLALRLGEASAVKQRQQRRQQRRRQLTSSGTDETTRCREDADEEKEPVALLDRSLFGDYAFAVRQALDGNISEEELRAYVAIRDERGFGDPTGSIVAARSACGGGDDARTTKEASEEGGEAAAAEGEEEEEEEEDVALLYIDVDPEVCFNRIASRGNEAEQTIPLRYLDDLDAVYVNLVLKVSVPRVFLSSKYVRVCVCVCVSLHVACMSLAGPVVCVSDAECMRTDICIFPITALDSCVYTHTYIYTYIYMYIKICINTLQAYTHGRIRYINICI